MKTFQASPNLNQMSFTIDSDSLYELENGKEPAAVERVKKQKSVPEKYQNQINQSEIRVR